MNAVFQIPQGKFVHIYIYNGPKRDIETTDAELYFFSFLISEWGRTDAEAKLVKCMTKTGQEIHGKLTNANFDIISKKVWKT